MADLDGHGRSSGLCPGTFTAAGLVAAAATGHGRAWRLGGYSFFVAGAAGGG